MSHRPIYILQPDGWPRTLARGLCMSMGCPPVDIADNGPGLDDAAGDISRSGGLALLDLQCLGGTTGTVVQLAARLPQEVRSRFVITRHRQGPVWPSDRAWVKSLGFTDLLPDLTPKTLLSETYLALELMAGLLALQRFDARAVARTLNQWPTTQDAQEPRALIWSLTRLDAESLALDLSGQVKALTRQHHLKTYPKSLLGHEIVDWLAQRHGLSREQALQAGQALMTLGFLHHVVHEQALQDQPFFYRSDCTFATLKHTPGDVLRLLKSPQGVKVTDRRYHGRNYPMCWVGSEAVQLLHDRWRVSLEDSESLLNRLWSYGLVRHVVDAHPVQNAPLFYRFVD